MQLDEFVTLVTRMRELTEIESVRLKELTYAPLVESDMLAIKAHIDDGTLSEDRLHALLGWIECGSWSGGREIMCRLDPARRHECKRLAAAAIFKQHRGRYVARGISWCSDDGHTLRGELR